VTNFGGLAMPTSTTGVGLSFTSSGSLQVGGGTTLYKNIVSIQANCPNYLSMISMSLGTNNQYYLASYANKQAFNSTLQLIEMTSGTTSSGTVLEILSVGYYIYEIVTLSSTSGIFLAICQDFSSSSNQAYLLMGKVSSASTSASPTISISSSKVFYSTSQYSVTPQLIALSQSSFALAYYDSDIDVNLPLAVTRYGKYGLYYYERCPS
jgi:hypothetical protein